MSYMLWVGLCFMGYRLWVGSVRGYGLGVSVSAPL